MIGTARSSLDRDEIFLDLLPSAIAGFFESIVCIYIYTCIREGGCSLDNGDYGKIDIFSFFKEA